MEPRQHNSLGCHPAIWKKQGDSGCQTDISAISQSQGLFGKRAEVLAVTRGQKGSTYPGEDVATAVLLLSSVWYCHVQGSVWTSFTPQKGVLLKGFCKQSVKTSFLPEISESCWSRCCLCFLLPAHIT